MDDSDQYCAEPELFASLCAIKVSASVPGIMATWTTSVSAGGDDVDD